MITSVQNTKIKMARELLSAKKHRERTRTMVVEGVRLAEEALAANASINFCLYSDHISERGKKVIRQIQALSFDSEEVSAELMDRISDTKTSQGILIAAPYPEVPLLKKADPVIVLDRIRDPVIWGQSYGLLRQWVSGLSCSHLVQPILFLQRLCARQWVRNFTYRSKLWTRRKFMDFAKGQMRLNYQFC